MEPAAIYGSLTARARRGAAAPFDIHVAACALAVAEADAQREGRALEETAGISSPALRELLDGMFENASTLTTIGGRFETVERASDEAQVLSLLEQAAIPRDFARLMAGFIARRALKPNHLWQDLGLADRAELGLLMRTYFPFLAHRNSKGMRWKKFLYRAVCRDGGHIVCPAPSCAECDELALCFGAEDGESQLSAAVGA